VSKNGKNTVTYFMDVPIAKKIVAFSYFIDGVVFLKDLDGN
jgi:hypothetical protein